MSSIGNNNAYNQHIGTLVLCHVHLIFIYNFIEGHCFSGEETKVQIVQHIF